MTAVAIQRRGGSTAAHAAFTGLQREMTIDTDCNLPVFHDGSTPGGWRGGAYKAPFTGSVLRSIEGRHYDVVSLLDFIPEAQHPAIRAYTSSYDCSLALTTALSTGRRVYSPAGKYCLNSPVTCTTNNAGIIGEGCGTVFVPTVATGNIFTLGNGSAEVSGLLFDDFRIWPSTAKTAGYAFHCQKVTDSLWRNVRVGSIDDYTANGHRLYHGIYFDGFSQNAVWGGESVVAQDHIRCRGLLDGSGNHVYAAELNIGGGNYRQYKGQVGVRLGGAAGGVKIHTGFDCSEAVQGIVCDRTLTNAHNRELFWAPAAAVDNCTTYALNINADSLVYGMLDGPWMSGNGATGSVEAVRVAPSTTTLTHLEISKPKIKENHGHGIAFSSGILQVMGGAIHNNSGKGIYVPAAATASDVQINKVRFDNNGGLGVHIEQSNVPLMSITDNAFFSNSGGSSTPQDQLASGTLINNSNIIVRGNIGAPTEMSNYVNIPNGSSSITVSYDNKLISQPNNLSVNFGGIPPSGAQVWSAPSNVDAVNKTVSINMNVNAGSGGLDIHYTFKVGV